MIPQIPQNAVMQRAFGGAMPAAAAPAMPARGTAIPAAPVSAMAAAPAVGGGAPAAAVPARVPIVPGQIPKVGTPEPANLLQSPNVRNFLMQRAGLAF